MSNSHLDFLNDIAFESGAVIDPEVAPALLEETLGDEIVAVQEPGASDALDRAEESEAIAEQLDDLAERAEELAEQQKAAVEGGEAINPQVVQVATESLHREFTAVMRANNMQNTFKAASFEAAGSERERAEGIARDARRVADTTRGYAKSVRDYSSEGTIWRAMRRDASRLDNAREALQGMLVAVQKNVESLKERPRKVSHQGIARFLTQNNGPVLNLKAGVNDDAKWLSQAHDTINSSMATLLKACNALKTAPTASVDSLLAGIGSQVSKLATKPGDLLGNHSVFIDGSGGVVPKLKRRDEFKFSKTALAGSIGWGILKGLGFHLNTILWLMVGGIAAGMVAPVATPVVGAALGAVGARRAVSTVMGVRAGVNEYNERANESKAVSVASASDLVDVFKTLLTFDRFTSFNLDTEQVANALDAAEAAGAPKASLRQVEDAMDNVIRIADIVYEQAIYDVVNGAQLASIAIR